MNRDVLIVATHDEAVAEALRGAQQGEIIEIHGEDCRGREEPIPPYRVIGCTCKPLVLTAGAVA
jgi:hypothetical protein